MQFKTGDIVKITAAYANHQDLGITGIEGFVTYSSNWDNYMEIRVKGRRYSYHQDRVKLITRKHRWDIKDWRFVYG